MTEIKMQDEQHIKVLAEDDGQRLDRWLKKCVPELPWGLSQKLIRKGAIRVNGGKAKTDTRLEEGQEVRIPRIEEPKKEKRSMYIREDDLEYMKSLILYDDGDILVLNKPGGLASQGGGGVERHLDGLLHLMPDKKGRRPRLIHRLDRPTSGALLCARKSSSVTKLGKAFQHRIAQKIYWALVSPAPELQQGTIKAPVEKGAGNMSDRMYISEGPDSKMAITDYFVLERAADKFAFVAFIPKTGRTHQLRVHSADVLGCPIVGDEKYAGAESKVSGLDIADGLYLHARRLRVPHPSNEGEMIDITAPLPPEIEKSWALLGFDISTANETLAMCDPFDEGVCSWL